MNPFELSQCIAAVYPTVKPTDYTYSTDALGDATIELWNNTVGVQPTAAQLQTALDGLNLKQAQQSQVALLKSTYDANRFGLPATVTDANNVTLIFPTDAITQTNLTGYLVAYADGTLPASGVPLQDASGAVQMLTFAQLQTLAKTIAQNSISAFQTLLSKCQQVSAATTVADVQAIVWS